ncbi:hypothetical protein Tco_0463759, partial [Tanacetum coccineum]
MFTFQQSPPDFSPTQPLPAFNYAYAAALARCLGTSSTPSTTMLESTFQLLKPRFSPTHFEVSLAAMRQELRSFHPCSSSSSNPAQSKSTNPFKSTSSDPPAQSKPAEILVSISAMPAYKDKNHEELRWEDY